jgi:rhodanese-related sulfurtransferase
VRSVLHASSLAVLLAAACVQIPDHGIDALTAMEQQDRGAAVVVDVRPPEERRAYPLKRTVAELPFGPDDWTGTMGETSIKAFVSGLSAFSARDKPLLFLCQAGIRSEAARVAAGRHGIAALSIRDGYLGNHYGPGWRAWE